MTKNTIFSFLQACEATVIKTAKKSWKGATIGALATFTLYLVIISLSYPKVCITFSIDHALVFQHPEVACSYRMRSKSVIAWGKVAYEEDFDKKVEALDIIMKQYSDKTFRYSDPAVRNVKIWTVDIDEVSCKEFGAPHKKSY